jgi:xanthosine utilization system XapX-like protein
MKLLYKPFAIIAGLIAARIGQSIFKSVWAKIDGEPPPIPAAGHSSLGKVVGARALEGAVMAGSAAAVDGALARAFHHLVGGWPTKPPEPKEQAAADLRPPAV